MEVEDLRRKQSEALLEIAREQATIAKEHATTAKYHPAIAESLNEIQERSGEQTDSFNQQTTRFNKLFVWFGVGGLVLGSLTLALAVIQVVQIATDSGPQAVVALTPTPSATAVPSPDTSVPSALATVVTP